MLSGDLRYRPFGLVSERPARGAGMSRETWLSQLASPGRLAAIRQASRAPTDPTPELVNIFPDFVGETARGIAKK